jgi:hypothetical protein
MLIEARRGGGFLIVLALAGLLSACGSTTPPTRSSDGIAYREDKDLQRVWIADGFAFQGYDVFHVQETRTEVPNVDAAVVVGAAEVKPGARGGYRSDKAIQEEDIRDLAVDLADFMVRSRTR